MAEAGRSQTGDQPELHGVTLSFLKKREKCVLERWANDEEHVCVLERWASDEEHVLFLQRIGVQFIARVSGVPSHIPPTYKFFLKGK